MSSEESGNQVGYVFGGRIRKEIYIQKGKSFCSNNDEWVFSKAWSKESLLITLFARSRHKNNNNRRPALPGWRWRRSGRVGGKWWVGGDGRRGGRGNGSGYIKQIKMLFK